MFHRFLSKVSFNRVTHFFQRLPTKIHQDSFTEHLRSLVPSPTTPGESWRPQQDFVVVVLHQEMEENPINKAKSHDFSLMIAFCGSFGIVFCFKIVFEMFPSDSPVKLSFGWVRPPGLPISPYLLLSPQSFLSLDFDIVGLSFFIHVCRFVL